MVGRVKPRRATVLINGDITVYLHPNQEWSSVNGTKKVYLVRHKMVTLSMSKEEINEYFKEI